MANVAVTITNIVKGTDAVTKEAKALDDLGKAGKNATPGVDSATKSAGGLQGAITKLAAGGLLLAAGKQILAFGKASLLAASDVQEMSSKFNTVFRDLSGSVTAELQEFADAANRSIFDLKGFAATLQDTFVPLGFARDKAADMSVQLVKLAEDLASFNNLPTQQVVEDLQSALVGNTETLRKYGVVATQAAIDEKALAMGLEFTKGKMDAQTKAAAILAITLDSTTDAAGDAIKTSDSYANTSRGLEAAMLDLKVAIGEELLPAATDLVVMFTSMAGAATKSVGVLSGLKNQLTDIAALVDRNSVVYRALVTALGVTNPALAQQLDLWAASEQMARKNASAVGAMAGKFNESAAATSAWTARIAQANPQLVALIQTSRDFADQYQENTRQAEFMAAVERDIANERGDYIVTTEMVADAENARTEAAQAAADAMAEQIARQKELAAATGDYFTAAVANEEAIVSYNAELGETATNQEAVNQAIFAAADASGASAEQLAILGGALGLYSEEAVNAALQTALIQAKIDELAAAYVAGDISVAGMQTSLSTFIQGLQQTDDEASALTSTLDDFPDQITTYFVSDLSGFKIPDVGNSVVTVPTTEAGRIGGVTAARGLDFTVPPGYPNDSYFLPLNVQSGERVTVTPTSGSAGSPTAGEQTTITINMIGSSATPQAVASAVSRVLTPPG